MIKNFLILILPALGYILNDNPADLIKEKTWRVVSFYNKQKSTEDKVPATIKGLEINFHKDFRITGKTEVNKLVLSRYQIYEPNFIQMKIAFTKICCDSKWSDRFLNNLYDAEEFSVNQDTLRLVTPYEIVKLVEVKK